MPRWPETGAALAAAACAFAFACAVAVADEGGESSEVSPRPDFAANHLLGDWAGARTALWELGLDPQVLLIVDPYGNPVGGKSQGFTTYSMLSVDLGVDAERLMGLAGGEFDVGFSFNFGEQLSQDWVGNVFPIQSSDVAPDGPRLTNLSWTQSFLDDRISVRAGRFSIDALYGEEFAGSEYFRSFTSVAFNAIPFALFYNAPGAFGYPATTWGARVRIDPTDDFYVMGGVYDGNPDAALADEHGLDFSFEGPTLAIGEIGFRFNQRPGDEGLPGNLKFGSYVLGGDVPAYGTGEPTSGRYGFYLVGDQSIVRFGEAEENRHLGVFGSLVVAPDEEASPMTWFFDAGLVAYGPIASRPKDFLSLGVAYGSFSTDLRESQEIQQLLDPSVDPQLFEMTIEASYGIHMAPGFTLQPGVQVIVNPGGSPDTPTAIAAGVNAVISF